MFNDNQQSELEQKMLKLKDGFLGVADHTPPFAFPEGIKSRDDVLTLLNRGLVLFEAVRRTRVAHEAALEAQEKALPALKQLRVDATHVARSHYGADEKKMATFGVMKPRRSKHRARRPECEAAGEVRATLVEEVVIDRESTLVERGEPACRGKSRHLPGRAVRARQGRQE